MVKSGVVGLQWGDEGKGKVVDALAGDFDYVARFNGGANAGHTVVIGDQTYKLHVVPDGIFRSKAVMGSNMVVYPPWLVDEIVKLRERGVEVNRTNLFIDFRVNVTTSYHFEEELTQEKARTGRKIGTTFKGIGPTYESLRGGFNLHQLVRGEHEAIVRENLKTRFRDLNVTAEKVLEELEPTRAFLGSFLYDTRELIRGSESVLFEPGQGHQIGIYTGERPYVTCSDPTLGGVTASFGYTEIPRRIGVAKAYSTRVGGGPFPTELDSQLGEVIREAGREYGTTTGRPRRCGWFDCRLVSEALKHSAVTELVITHLDTLSEIPELTIGMRDGHSKSMGTWERISPDVKRKEDLPKNARNYITTLESELSVPVSMVSVGPERTQLVRL
ncbi:MAG: adenylosuccinate synthetase [Candidatus Woesearchaeota archaeon]